MDRDTVESSYARRPSARRWPVAAGAAAALGVAAVGGILLVSSDDPEPADATSVRTVAVYYLADTSGGLRLRRELEPLPPRVQALDEVLAALTAPPDATGLRTLWPAGSFGGIREFHGTVEVTVADPALLGPASLDAAEARASVQQVVRTLQEAVGDAVPVQFLFDGAPAPRLLGLDATEPFTSGADTRTR